MDKSDRRSWESTFMIIAQEMSSRSHCLRCKIGVVIANMRPGREAILTSGYNGPPRGIEHCDEIGCHNYSIGKDGQARKKRDGYCIGAHAEINAIVNATRDGVCIEGATLFVTCSPCFECAKHIVNSGLAEVVYLERYSKLFPSKPGVREEEERALALISKRKKCWQME